MLWAQVITLGDDKEGRDLQRQGNAQVLLAHSNQSCVCPNNQASIVWHVTREAVRCSTEVALVASEINQGYDLKRHSNGSEELEAEEKLLRCRGRFAGGCRG